MEEKELMRLRNKPQQITNILNEVFDFRWDGEDYSIKPGETQMHPYYLAERAAFHMARKYITQDKNKKPTDFNRECGKIIDKIMSKKFIEYSKLNSEEAKKLAEERGISLTENDKAKSLNQLRKELRESH